MSTRAAQIFCPTGAAVLSGRSTNHDSDILSALVELSVSAALSSPLVWAVSCALVSVTTTAPSLLRGAAPVSYPLARAVERVCVLGPHALLPECLCAPDSVVS